MSQQLGIQKPDLPIPLAPVIQVATPPRSATGAASASATQAADQSGTIAAVVESCAAEAGKQAAGSSPANAAAAGSSKAPFDKPEAEGKGGRNNDGQPVAGGEGKRTEKSLANMYINAVAVGAVNWIIVRVVISFYCLL